MSITRPNLLLLNRLLGSSPAKSALGIQDLTLDRQKRHLVELRSIYPIHFETMGQVHIRVQLGFVLV